LEASKPFDLERQAAYARLALSPNLNAFHWADVERSGSEILASLEQPPVHVVIIDLAALDYLGSAQLTLLVRVWKVIQNRGGKMAVIVKGPVVREVLKTAGLSTLWQLVETPAEAFQSLGLQADGRPRMTMIWPIVGLVALTGALAGLCASMMKAEGIDGRVSLVVQLACSSIALAAGLWTVIRGSGARRGLGVGMVVASALLAVVEVLQTPR
jgi:anti-anti-sigma factor